MSRAQKTLPVTDAEAISRSVRERLRERKPVLVVIAGPDVGVHHVITGRCVVGRGPQCDIVLRDARASTTHARFEVVDAGQVALVDLGSTNGTFVNERRVERTHVLGGDKVIIGSTVIRLEWHDALDHDFHQELERLISVDELTGLKSKRRFDAEGETLVEGAIARGAMVTVLMMDLDGIKRINDTHGHVFGAYCIAEAGALMGRVIGERGIATRWGGDEYSAVLPGLDGDAGYRVAEEILAAIVGHRFEHDGVVVHPGVSIGLAVGPEAGRTLEALQRRADEALYRAKAAGKGRVSR